jgi:hypothetical protein
MTDDLPSPIDLSAEAALELEEVNQGKRTDAPTLVALFSFLRTPAPAAEFEGNGSLSMLDDARAYVVLRDSISPRKARSGDLSEFKKLVESYFIELETGVNAKKKNKVEEAKRFCISLNENLLSKRMAEICQRRERSDFRYVSHDSLS